MVHPGGRPREWDRDEIMYRLLQWAELPNSLNLNAFCVLPEVMISPVKLVQFAREDAEFRLVYDIAKAFIASRREEANSEKILSDKAFAISHAVYDLIQKNENREELEFESSLKEKENVPLNNESLDKFFESLPHIETINKLKAEIDELKRQANLKHSSSEKKAKHMGGSCKKRKDVLKHTKAD